MPNGWNIRTFPNIASPRAQCLSGLEQFISIIGWKNVYRWFSTRYSPAVCLQQSGYKKKRITQDAAKTGFSMTNLQSHSIMSESDHSANRNGWIHGAIVPAALKTSRSARLLTTWPNSCQARNSWPNRYWPISPSRDLPLANHKQAWLWTCPWIMWPNVHLSETKRSNHQWGLYKTPQTFIFL